MNDTAAAASCKTDWNTGAFITGNLITLKISVKEILCNSNVFGFGVTTFWTEILMLIN